MVVLYFLWYLCKAIGMIMVIKHDLVTDIAPYDQSDQEENGTKHVFILVGGGD